MKVENNSDLNPTSSLHFRWQWRPYQNRVLDALEPHLSDQRLHIVAAPGAGKTTLGLEVFRRLGKQALILAPTRVIRDQWILQLSDFLPEDAEIPPRWTSRSLEQQAYLTAVTYQALYAKQKQKPDAQDLDEALSHVPVYAEALDEQDLHQLIDIIRAAHIRVLILDEAHHLRAGWWSVLTKLVSQLPQLTIVALTGTPPYDVVGHEWARYEALCGPIDEEISVPELVQSGTLCPHQDFVWAVLPTSSEIEHAALHDQHVAHLEATLRADAVFRHAVKHHKWLHPEFDTDKILSDPPYMVALLAFLTAIEENIPSHLIELFDCTADELPTLNNYWWQVLLQRYLFVKMGWPDDDAINQHKKELARSLRLNGLLFGKELRIEHNREIAGELARSASKIMACIDIHNVEVQTRGYALRQAILTDFIREHDHRLGAWPVFMALVSHSSAPLAELAMITGKTVIVHESQLARITSLLGPKADLLKVDEDPEINNFVRLNYPGGGARLVPGITILFNSGHIKTLVGTRSLLGEGWNAPSLNSLIMATFVGSHMTTNQIRGRAIRRDPATPEKVASIWHIAALDTRTQSGLDDLQNLKRRFRTFVGLAARRPHIESGFGRLSLPEISQNNDISTWNAIARERLGNLETIDNLWEEAIDVSVLHRVIPTIEAHKQKLPSVRPYVYGNTLRYLLLSSASILFTFFAEGLNLLQNAQSWTQFKWGIIATGVIGLYYTTPRLFKSVQMAALHTPVEGTIRQIALALREALLEADFFTTPAEQLKVKAVEWRPGVWSVAIEGATFFEQSMYSDAMAEVMRPINNARYILTRKGSGPWSRRKDYHAVPTVLANNKKNATLFAEKWQKRVGPTALIYTRTKEGRKILLQSRVKALSNLLGDDFRRRDQWH